MLVLIMTDGIPNKGPQPFIHLIRDTIANKATTGTFKFQIMACTLVSSQEAQRWAKSCHSLGSVFGRTDFSRIFIFGPPDFFADFVAGFFLLIFVGKSAQKNPPGKFPAKSSKTYTTKIPVTFLQRGRANIVIAESLARVTAPLYAVALALCFWDALQYALAACENSVIIFRICRCSSGVFQNQFGQSFLGNGIAESLARVMAVIRITSVRWRSYGRPKHRDWSSETLRSLCCDLDRAIGARSCTFVPRGAAEWLTRVDCDH